MNNTNKFLSYGIVTKNMNYPNLLNLDGIVQRRNQEDIGFEEIGGFPLGTTKRIISLSKEDLKKLDIVRADHDMGFSSSYSMGIAIEYCKRMFISELEDTEIKEQLNELVKTNITPQIVEYTKDPGFKFEGLIEQVQLAHALYNMFDNHTIDSDAKWVKNAKEEINKTLQTKFDNIMSNKPDAYTELHSKGFKHNPDTVAAVTSMVGRCAGSQFYNEMPNETKMLILNQTGEQLSYLTKR